MNDSTTCRLPDEVAQDVEQHALDVERFLRGELTASVMKSRRVPRGIYEQRRNGTYMLRVRVPGGAISTSQVRLLADVASRRAGDTLHVTTRQDIQLHDVDLGQTPDILRELLPAGLSSRGGGGNTVRNVTACPFAGICPAEYFDVTPGVVAVTEHLIGLPGSYNLPRKYKIAFSGCGADCALAQVSDLGFIAHVRDGRPGFSVYAGGGMGASSRVGDRMEEWVPASETVRIAEAVRRLFDRLGDRRNRHRARLRFAVERVGADAFRDLLREAVETVTREGVPAAATPADVAPSPIVPLGDCRTLPVPTGAGVDVLRQRQAGFVAIPLHLRVGEIRCGALRDLADVADRFSAEKMLRTTQDQNVLLPYVRESDLPALRSDLKRILGPDSIREASFHAFTACTGAATCRLGLCLSQNAARACADALADAQIDPVALRAVDIRINGCPNACGQHPVGTIGLVGAAQRVGERLLPSYRVLLGARRGEGRTRFGSPAGAVPARALPLLLVDLLRDFLSGRGADEPFADYFDRRGLAHFQALLARHTPIPSYAEDPAFYRDWGRDEDFSLAGRGPGECSSGVFEIIAEDLSSATKALERAQQEGAGGAALTQALLAAARALLVTRGVDAQDAAGILQAFETHFIATGLVDTGFRPLLATARGPDSGTAALDDVRRLLERVAYLYSTMDGDLRFHVEDGRV